MLTATKPPINIWEYFGQTDHSFYERAKIALPLEDVQNFLREFRQQHKHPQDCADDEVIPPLLPWRRLAVDFRQKFQGDDAFETFCNSIIVPLELFGDDEIDAVWADADRPLNHTKDDLLLDMLGDIAAGMYSPAIPLPDSIKSLLDSAMERAEARHQEHERIKEAEFEAAMDEFCDRRDEIDKLLAEPPNLDRDERLVRLERAQSVWREKWEDREWTEQVVNLVEMRPARTRQSTTTLSATKAVLLSTAADLQQRSFAPVRWVAAPYLCEGLTLLASKPKKGKSWFVLDAGLAVAGDDGTFLGKAVAHGDVLYLALEDNDRRMKDRITKLAGPFSTWPARFHYATEWPRGDEAVAKIREWVDGHPDARLVIVDVLTKIRPLVAAKGTTAYEADYAALESLQKLAREKGIGIVVVHHTRKSGMVEGGDVFDIMSGTLGLNGCADTLMVFHQDTNGMSLHVRGRDVEELAHSVQFDKPTCRWRVLGEADDVRLSDERQRIVAALKEAGQPMGYADLAAACDMKVENVRKLLFKMWKDGKVERVGKGLHRLPTTPGPNGPVGPV